MPDIKSKILLIEDEEKIRKFITISMKTLGMNIEEAMDGGQGIRMAGSIQPDLIISDLGLPDMDGLEVIQQIREFSSIPILVLSARSEDSDIVAALDLGADDYLVKPFNVEVLAARVRVALRKAVQEEANGSAVLECGGLKLDVLRRQLTRDGEEISLSPKEYQLTKYLMTHSGKMLTHENILKDVWGEAHLDDGHYLRIYIGQVRKKIERDPANPEYVLTQPGVGYLMDSPTK